MRYRCGRSSGSEPLPWLDTDRRTLMDRRGEGVRIIRHNHPGPFAAGLRLGVETCTFRYVHFRERRIPMKTVGAAEFKARCLRLIKQMNQDGEPLTVTNRGRPVAILSPVPERARSASIIGAMAGTVLAYDDPLAPAADPSEWASLR